MQFNRNFGLFDTCKMHFNPYLSLMLLAVFAIMFIFVKKLSAVLFAKDKMPCSHVLLVYMFPIINLNIVVL